MNWIHHCWDQILEGYYYQFIAGEVALKRPLAVEGKIQGQLQAENLEFRITGRYDRLDYLEDGLELIDYKSTKEVKLPDPAEIDLQIGLYYLALEQRYRQSLKRLSLLYLRTGEKISFEASACHKQQVEATISELAWRLRTDSDWEPTPGEQCDRCSYLQYCPTQDNPEPVPNSNKSCRQMQLVLNL